MPRSLVKMKQYSVRVNGILVRKYFASATEARKWQRSQKAVQDQMRSGSYRDLQPTLLSVQAVEFLKSRKHQAQYQHQETWMAKYVLMRRQFKDKYVHELTRPHWKPLFGPDGELIKVHGLAPATHNLIRAMLHKFYQDARREYDPPRALDNPITDIPPMPVPKKKPQFLGTVDQIKAYLEAANHDRLLPCWGIYSMIKLNTGLRQSNVMALRWCDIDWQGRRIWVRLKYTRQRGFVPGSKGSDDEKVLGMNDALYGALKEWKAKARPASEDEVICLNQKRQPLTVHQIWDAHARTIEAARIPYMSEHKLRHTYASHFLSSGGTMHDLKLNLFHSTITVTEKYSHALESELGRRAGVFQVTNEPSKASKYNKKG